jgi:hypothetical protein
LNGSVVLSFISNGVTTNVYDVHDLTSGTYIIRITDKTNNSSQSLLFSKL